MEGLGGQDNEGRKSGKKTVEIHKNPEANGGSQKKENVKIWKTRLTKCPIRVIIKIHSVLVRKTGDLVERIDVFLVCGMVICFAAAGLWDLAAGRVPNRWLAFWFAVGFVYFACSSWLEAAGYLARSAAAVSLFFLFFLVRMMGAADIKCMALLCGYLGFGTGFQVIGTGLVIGACWSLARLLRRRLLQERLYRLIAYIGQTVREKKITAYYIPERDGKEGVIPLVFCLFWGLVFRVCFRLG